jgi:hypothetical protein
MADDRRDEEIQLPPAFLKFQAQLKADKKTLMRGEAYGKSPDQLRAFVGTHLFQRLDELVMLMGLALFDTYGLAVSTESQVQRMRAVYGKALKKVASAADVSLDIEGEDGELPGLSPEILDEFQQAFYALGTLLQKKLPEDKETETAFNKCAEILSDMVAELMGDVEDEDEGDEDDDEDLDDEDDEDESESASEIKDKPEEAKDKPGETSDV